MRGALLGLVVNPDPAHTQFEGRLSIPFITPTGVVYMRFRCLEEHDCAGHGKYEGPPGEETRLYNVGALHSADAVIAICEGELDACVSSNAGLPAVGVPGANNWKSYYYRLFDDFDRVIIVGDGDSAGRKFVNTLSNTISGSVPRPMPEGHDVNSYVLAHGPEEYLRFIMQQ